MQKKPSPFIIKTMKRWYFIFVFLLFPAFLYALSVEEVAEKLEQKVLSSGKIYIQIENTRFLPKGEKIQMKGLIWLKMPDKFRMDIFPPYQSITLLKGKQLLIYFPQDKVLQVVTLSKDPKLSQWLNFLQKPWEEIKRRGVIRDVEKEGILVEIDPKDLPELESLRIWVDQSLWFPTKIEMKEKNGEVSLITYSKVEFGASFGDDLFDLKFPPDVQVTEL